MRSLIYRSSAIRGRTKSAHTRNKQRSIRVLLKSARWPRTREFTLPELPSQDLSNEGFRQVLRELDGLRNLERRKSLLAEGDDLGLRGGHAALQDDEGLHGLAAICIGNPDCRGLSDRGVHEQDLLDLPRIYVVSGAEDEVLLPVHDGEVAVLIHLRDVSGEEPSVSEHGRRPIRMVPVSLHHLWAAHGELARLARTDRPRRIFRIDEFRVRVGERDADAFLHDPVQGIAVRDGGGLREAVSFDEAAARGGLELLPHFVRKWSGTRDACADGTQVVLRDIRMAQDRDVHRGD